MCVRNARTCYSNLKQRRACLRHTPYSRPARSLGWESQRFTLFVGLCLRLTQLSEKDCCYSTNIERIKLPYPRLTAIIAPEKIGSMQLSMLWHVTHTSAAPKPRLSSQKRGFLRNLGPLRRNSASLQKPRSAPQKLGFPSEASFSGSLYQTLSYSRHVFHPLAGKGALDVAVHAFGGEVVGE